MAIAVEGERKGDGSRGGRGQGKWEREDERAHHSQLNQRAKKMVREGFLEMRELNKNSIIFLLYHN